MSLNPEILTCRTVSFEGHRALGNNLPAFTLAGLSPEQQAAFIQAYPIRHPQHFNPDALIEQLRNSPQLSALTANPQLLDILCFVADDPGGVQLPATRGELYDRAVDKLLQRKRHAASSPLPLARKRALVEEAALQLWLGLEGSRRLTFDEGIVLEALTEAARTVGYGEAPASIADALLADLRDNSGLLRGEAGGDYFFLHLTLQEFLAASALARGG